MTCQYSPHLLPVYFAYLITNCSGFFGAVFALICVFSNSATERALRHTLISFSVGNLLGPYMLAYDSKSLICNRDDKNLDFVVIVTMTLSLSHLILLLIYFYGTLKSTKQQEQHAGGSRVTSFVIISWTLSLVIGGMYVVSDRSEARLFCGVIIAFTATIIILSYLITLYKHKWKRHSQYVYSGASWGTGAESDGVDSSDADVYIKVILLGVVILGYVGSTLPWVVEELQEGLNPGFSGKDDPHTLSMVAYSLNFYFPIFFCIFLRYRMWKLEQNGTNSTEV